MKKFLFSLFALIASLLIAKTTCLAQANSFEELERRIETHINTTLGNNNANVTSKESAVEQMINRNEDKFDSEEYDAGGQSVSAAEEHPWLKNGTPRGVNPNFLTDYQSDSRNTWDGTTNIGPSSSCFEPQLIAYGDCDDNFAPTADLPLSLSCRAYCCAQELTAYLRWLASPFLRPEHDADGDFYRDRNRNNDEYYEVIQFWYPEHQVSINNYGRMRMNPIALTGNANARMLRDALARTKSGADTLIAQELDRNLPLQGENTVNSEENPDWREDPFIGQYQSGAGVDHYAAHVYRTHISSQLGDNQLTGTRARHGFERNERSIYSALEPNTTVKPQLAMWTEDPYFDFLTSVDSASFSIRGDEQNRAQRFMNALYGRNGNWLERAQSGFYRNRGETSYRSGKWSQYSPIREIAQINPSSSSVLEEIVYFGGQSLYPLSMTYDNPFLPEASKRANAARKALELSANTALINRLPNGPQSKINAFTVNGSNRALEIDKIQRIYPLNENGQTGECYRSQKIPNILQQTEDRWTAEQFPADLMGSVDEDFTDSAYVYWNKKVVCSCKRDGPLFGTGSVAMNFPATRPGRGDGDRLYGQIENTLCSYPPGTLPSAFAGEQRPPCPIGAQTSRAYEGLRDAEVANNSSSR